MSIYVELKEDGSIQTMHAMPFHPVYGLGKTQTELEKTGKFINSMPAPAQPVSGKNAVMKYNPENNTLFYEYEDVPKTPEQVREEEFQQLKEDNAFLLYTLMMEGII